MYSIDLSSSHVNLKPEALCSFRTPYLHIRYSTQKLATFFTVFSNYFPLFQKYTGYFRICSYSTRSTLSITSCGYSSFSSSNTFGIS